MPRELEVPVRLNPGSSRDRIEGDVGGRVRISTAAPPVDGRANAAAGRLLAKAFGVPASRVRLKRGAKSRLKTFVVTDPACIPEWAAGIAEAER